MFGNPVRNSKNWNTEKLCSIAPINKYNGDIDTINGKVWLLNLDMIESCTGNIVDFLYEFENRITSSTIKFDENCVLYSKLRPYLNKVVIPERKGYATSELVSMSTEKINKYFLANLLRQDSFVNFSNATAYGAKMPRASMDLIKNFDVINPPTELQNQFGKLVIEVEKSKVMLDFDLAEIYGYSTKRFNEQVKNNIEKFDDDFMFQLSRDEWEILRSKNLTSKSEVGSGGRRYCPYAFTEQGIYMLMTVLMGELSQDRRNL
jgi:hypothetical protein